MSEGSSRDGATVRFPPPFLYLISIGLGHLLHRFVHPWPLPGLEGETRENIALGILFAGTAIAAIAIAQMGRSGQNPEPWKPTPSILTKGIYRYSRNPMYVALALIQVGVGIGLGNLWVVALTTLALVAVFFVAVRPEEIYLEGKFGDQYLAYKASVRRWL